MCIEQYGDSSLSGIQRRNLEIHFYLHRGRKHMQDGWTEISKIPPWQAAVAPGYPVNLLQSTHNLSDPQWKWRFSRDPRLLWFPPSNKSGDRIKH